MLTNFLDLFARLLGPALVVFAVILILFCTYVFFDSIVPYYREVYQMALPIELVLSTTGLFILFNCLYNYYKAVVTSPGIPPLASDYGESGPETTRQPPSLRTALGNRLRQYERLSDSEDEDHASRASGRMPVCSKCDRIRPPRTHHCSVLKSCVYRYDHYCPWIYNCVGYGNFKFFYLFLFHVFLVDMFFVLVSIPVFRYALSLSVTDVANLYLPGSQRPQVVMSFVLAAAVEIAMAGFLGLHTFLLLTNQTTMEWATGGYSRRFEGTLRQQAKFQRNPYDLGLKRNWQQVMGNRGWWKWAFSFLHKDEARDGEIVPSFPTVGVVHDTEHKE